MSLLKRIFLFLNKIIINKLTCLLSVNFLFLSLLNHSFDFLNILDCDII